KVGIDKMKVNGGEITEDSDDNVYNVYNDSIPVDNVQKCGNLDQACETWQEVRSDVDNVTVNGKVNNKEKHDTFKVEKKDTESMRVNNRVNAGKTKAKATGFRNGKSYVGSKRWEKTLCGYFVGYSMSVNELRYNLRRMRSRYRFKEIVDFNNGIYFIKFHSDEGLNHVVNSGPWMKPPMCNKCCVFGHNSTRCGKVNGEEDVDTIRKDTNMGSNTNERNKQMDDTNTDSEEFTAV
nr:hypothetical protein [Tanacetum cinerariifolium]